MARPPRDVVFPPGEQLAAKGEKTVIHGDASPPQIILFKDFRDLNVLKPLKLLKPFKPFKPFTPSAPHCCDAVYPHLHGEAWLV